MDRQDAYDVHDRPIAPYCRLTKNGQARIQESASDV